METIKLHIREGAFPIWVNPQYIVALSPGQLDYDGLTIVHLSHPTLDFLVVQETPDQIRNLIQQLEIPWIAN